VGHGPSWPRLPRAQDRLAHSIQFSLETVVQCDESSARQQDPVPLVGPDPTAPATPLAGVLRAKRALKISELDKRHWSVADPFGRLRSVDSQPAHRLDSRAGGVFLAAVGDL
jgi:hypothetical protein